MLNFMELNNLLSELDMPLFKFIDAIDKLMVKIFKIASIFLKITKILSTPSQKSFWTFWADTHEASLLIAMLRILIPYIFDHIDMLSSCVITIF